VVPDDETPRLLGPARLEIAERALDPVEAVSRRLLAGHVSRLRGGAVDENDEQGKGHAGAADEGTPGGLLPSKDR